MTATGSSRLESIVCVAPRRRASSSFSGTTSAAITFEAPESTPPCTQLRPMPPRPKTAMVAPVSTLARFTTAPKPVMMPQPISAAQSNGTRGSMGMALCSRTTVRSTKQEVLANEYACTPLTVNGLLSFGLGALRHCVGLPTSQAGQRPQCDRVESTTVSPSFTLVTPGPTASTIPAPSCPRTTGTGYGMVPSMTLTSEWQSPAALRATRTSPGPGSLRVTSSITTGRSTE